MALIPSNDAVPTMPPFSVSFGGLVFGSFVEQPYTQAYQLAGAGIVGLDLPALRTGDVNRPRTHGELIGLDFLAGRDITLDIIVTATVANTLQENLATLRDALALTIGDEQPLFVAMPDAIYGTMARVRKRNFGVGVNYILAGAAEVAVMFHATDPRLYATPTQTLGSAPIAPPSGVTFPIVFPVSWASSPADTAIVVDNVGNIDCAPVITLTGPLTNPVVRLASDPNTPAIGFTASLAAGQTLVIDMDARTVLLDGLADRRYWLTPGASWWTFAPGNNSVTLSSDDDGVAAGALQVEWASAFDSL